MIIIKMFKHQFILMFNDIFYVNALAYSIYWLSRKMEAKLLKYLVPRILLCKLKMFIGKH